MSPTRLSRLELLPLEIKGEILELLLPQEIKDMRLLNRLMHEVSSPYLMKRVYFALREETIKIFDLIVEHPIFSTTIEEIVFDCSLFGFPHYGCSCPKGIFRCVCNGNKCMENCTTYAGVTTLLEDGASEHERLLDTQVQIATTGLDTRSLEKAAMRCSKLRSLVISDWQTIDATFPPPDTSNTWYRSGKLMTRVPYTNKALDSHSWYIRKGPMKWDVTNACFPETISDKAKTKQNCIDVMQSWCGVFRNGNSSIWKFEAKLFGWTPYPIGKPIPLSAITPKMAPNTLVMCENDRQFAESLHDFEISFRIELNDIINGPEGKLRTFQTMLASMQTLERLDLACAFPLIRGADIGNVCDRIFFIKEIHWPRLRWFTLSGAWYVQAPSFVDFLRRHGSTLYQIRLGGLLLEETNNETWVDIAEKLRTYLPSLRRCMLANLSEFGRKPFHLNYLSYDGDKTKPKGDCAYRRRHLNTLQQFILGRGRLSSKSRTKVQEVRMNWHNYDAMNRGPSTEEEFNMRQQNGATVGSESPSITVESGTVS